MRYLKAMLILANACWINKASKNTGTRVSAANVQHNAMPFPSTIQSQYFDGWQQLLIGFHRTLDGLFNIHF